MSGQVGPVVVVADDHDGVREMAAFVLTMDGMVVLEARDGAEALALVRQHAVAVALIDLGLPELDGIEVCRSIRQDPATAGTRVLIITGALDAASQRRIAEAAPDGVMGKPFLPNELVAATRALVPS
jgi:CheY-like chemotaxis protein